MRDGDSLPCPKLTCPMVVTAPDDKQQQSNSTLCTNHRMCCICSSRQVRINKPLLANLHDAAAPTPSRRVLTLSPCLKMQTASNLAQKHVSTAGGHWMAVVLRIRLAHATHNSPYSTPMYWGGVMTPPLTTACKRQSKLTTAPTAQHDGGVTASPWHCLLPRNAFATRTAARTP
jgi:hypothetical protein